MKITQVFCWDIFYSINMKSSNLIVISGNGETSGIIKNTLLLSVRVEHRLVLFYLANDVIQYSKRKRLEFVESWATALQKATTMVRYVIGLDL